MSSQLAQESLQPCPKGTQPMSRDDAEALISQLDGWKLAEGSKTISRLFSFKNYAEALAFVLKVSELAESANHHPDVHFGWGYVELELTTHFIGGLHRNDFVIASKINAL